MKKVIFRSLLIAALISSFIACKKDKNNDDNGNTIINDPANVAKDNLVAYFPFDGDGIEKVNNIAPLTITSQVKFTAGQRGQSYQGDSLAYMIYDLPSTNRITNMRGFTLSLWIKVPKIANAVPPIPVIFQINGTTDPVWGNFAFGQERSDMDSINFHFFFYNDSAAIVKGQHIVYSNPGFPAATWMYLTVSYDSATSKFYIFVKGLRLAIPETIVNRTGDDPANGGKPLGSLIFNNATQMVVGTWWNLATGGATVQTENPWMGYFKGQMDELRFYNRALTDAEVLTLYNAEVAHLSQY